MAQSNKHRISKLCGLALVLAAATASFVTCIDSRCTQDSECPAGSLCLKSLGSCVAPECVRHSECKPGLICENHFCVSGCLTDDDCAGGMRCHQNRCAVYGEGDCECPQAPQFCGSDMNPHSPTYEQQLCVPASYDKGVALFFGSVKCSHCRDLIKEILPLGAQLRAEGYDASVVFVHIKTVDVGASDVGNHMSGISVPVIHDSDAADIWAAYGGDWYDMALVDAEGCSAEHFKTLVPEDVIYQRRDEIIDAWKAAISRQCKSEPPPPADVVIVADTSPPDIAPPPDDGPDLDTVDGGGPDVSPNIVEVHEDSTAELPDVTSDGDGPEVDGFADVPQTDQGPADADPPPVIEPCTITYAEPMTVGQKVPSFSCTDVNAGSPTLGDTITDVSLGELVWIAYFGSCT